MYEHQTYEAILARMLDKIPDDIDKREGSIIYDALSPAAIEMAQVYAELDVFLRLAFADTSSGDYLSRRTAEYGIDKKLATFAVRKGIFKDSQDAPLDVPLDSRFRLNSVTYRVIEKIVNGEFKLRAEIAGEIGNRDFGDLLPIEPIQDLALAELKEVIIPGLEEESDADLLKRYSYQIRRPSTSGNANHYRQWALEVNGVGDAKVIPTWNGNGTVKVILLGDDKRSPNQTIIDNVIAFVESVRPVNVGVTVVGVTEVPIHINVTVSLASGKTLADAETEISQEINKYFQLIAFSDTVVRYSQIGSIILNAPSVLDYSNLLVNNTTGNIEISDDAVAVLGSVAIS